MWDLPLIIGGYKASYFGNIKNLEMGDEIIYKTPYGTRTYIVNDTMIIDETDWTYLGETEENKITLITCVENRPAYRRCVQGIEKQA